ncbi:MBL fold metallo-hydrolase [Planomicrobium sp. CPCC 101110]|uniref:MBL fold metallo-hydrolase n=1 Tax=Planomicrobium sp. CPCC 101110 TaxID=2599619 RepID=UPI0011B59260|nr:MBL fold metallo-hydrolase [Planomicrobium sp. CPCC 101110]TWT27144.1 MBL fold metallo-hydrolase [Planomicrobium sp. CPCC 101110]
MLKKLTERVYYKPHFQKTDRPVIGVITGDDFSLVVDAGNSPAHASEFLESIRTESVSPLKFLAVTHWHWDHIFGIHTMDLVTLSHLDTKQRIDYLSTLQWDDDSLDLRVQTGEEIEFCRDMIKLEMPERNHLQFKSPELSFSDKMEVDLGNLTCVIEHVGGVHAQDSSIIYIPQEKVMFLGDCLAPDFYSGDWSYDRNELQLLLKKISKYEVDYYVTSHNEPETYQELWNYLNMLKGIGNIVGADVSILTVKDRYKKVENKIPNEEEITLMEYFINGNIKRGIKN